MIVDRCVFVDGFHVYLDGDCPHTRLTDEEGPVIPTGWTVQTGPSNQPVRKAAHSGYSNEE